MRPTGLPLDEEIAEVEARIVRHRAALRLMAAEVRSRFSAKSLVPAAFVVALVAAFAASRMTHKRPAPDVRRHDAGTPRLFAALAAALLPVIVRPLQAAVVHWLAERLRRANARGSDEAAPKPGATPTGM